MEAWRELARRGFDDATCIGSESHFDTISISACSSQPTTCQRRRVQAEDVKDMAKQPSISPKETSTSSANLQVLRIRRGDSEQVRISAQLFRTVFKSFNLDPAILYLISNNSYGFHHFHSETSTSTSDTSTSCYFIGTVLYVLFWSFDAKTMMNRAIIMTRNHNGVYPEQTAFDIFATTLELYKDQVYTPHLLAVVAATQLARFLDTGVLAQLHFLRSVEAYTGHGSYVYIGADGSTPTPDLEGISKQSRKIGASLVVMANERRHVEIADSLVTFLQDPQSDMVNRNGITMTADLSKSGSALKLLQSVLPVLKRQLQNTRAYHLYLAERARNQSSVLSGLLSHQDAVINTNLASSSREIADATRKDGLTMQALATATKKDGEAIKTIAVMTMAFLPGTFFAALFAIPSLRWDQRPVIQDGFGIYWAFTLPATLIVFFIWILLTNWYGVYDFIVAWVHKGKKSLPQKNSETINGEYGSSRVRTGF